LREAAGYLTLPGDPGQFVERVLAETTDSFFDVYSPIGPVYVVAGLAGIRFIAPAASPEEFARRYRERFGRLLSPALGNQATLAGKVTAALAGKKAEVNLDLSWATPFQQRVLKVVRDIPLGEVRPYVWVAWEAGAPGASRAVGNVMANNPVPLLVPCHRVIRNDGHTGNYAFGAGEKVRLLREEGVAPEELAREAVTAGYRACKVCRPVVAA
jgi:methylated-DNA-[protein]-cysteine S-methyltransferase